MPIPQTQPRPGETCSIHRLCFPLSHRFLAFSQLLARCQEMQQPYHLSTGPARVLFVPDPKVHIQCIQQPPSSLNQDPPTLFFPASPPKKTPFPPPDLRRCLPAPTPWPLPLLLSFSFTPTSAPFTWNFFATTSSRARSPSVRRIPYFIAVPSSSSRVTTPSFLFLKRVTSSPPTLILCIPTTPTTLTAFVALLICVSTPAGSPPPIHTPTTLPASLFNCSAHPHILSTKTVPLLSFIYCNHPLFILFSISGTFYNPKPPFSTGLVNLSILGLPLLPSASLISATTSFHSSLMHTSIRIQYTNTLKV
eukprot:TRINITY_DN10156_c0_g1_i3.p1 TRINITY_DN10156_c0_g1~~TRINITY_DN10156_c0_g1_i3.p1  ORF type:complete len:307 (+),score=20.32 TRINITY_DN10156_c0_g1_i3:154-1074(+)